ncbi:hypothetical protein [Bradyrhizobium sp. 87]|uniref:hypothetical protein n=1 Tax=Bradyrhizobium sp. 87 TaxID=2782682 RepID=UPI001FF800D3|nr:hypothetical protein [Bradyrhizobium sp. 87]
MPGAVQPYQRLLKRPKADSDVWLKNVPEHPKKPSYPEPTDPLFPSNHIKMFNGVLRRTKLKLDREGNKRTAYSLRHTYICMRLIEGADIYALAKNRRTSADMIQKFYAAHIKDLLDASAINVMRPKRTKRPSGESPDKRPD